MSEDNDIIFRRPVTPSVPMILRRAPLIDLGDTGGVRFELVTKGFTKGLRIIIFEGNTIKQIDRAAVIIPLGKGIDLIKILCKLCSVETQQKDGIA